MLSHRISSHFADLPWVHLFLSLRCNLRCVYCSQQYAIKSLGYDDQGGMSDEALRAFYQSIPPSHFYLSGGEPLIYPGIKELVAGLMEHGHRVSFDTNLVIPLDTLRAYLSAWDLAKLGFINISHHHLDIPLAYVLDRVRLLKEAGAPFFVKYIGLPGQLAEIDNLMNAMRQQGAGTMITVLQGIYKGKGYPAAYSDEDIDRLVEMFTVVSHGLQLFDGVFSLGMPCRGGNDYIGLRKYHPQPFITCCHGELSPLELSSTYFGGQPKNSQPCPHPQCVGYLLFTLGINGIFPELERFDAMLAGESPPVGREAFCAFLQDLIGRGYFIVDQQGLQRYLARWHIDLKELAGFKQSTWRRVISPPLSSALKCTAEAHLSHEDGCLHMASIPQQWAYICQFELEQLAGSQGRMQAQIDLEVGKGCLGIGLLHRAEKHFLREILVTPAGGHQKVILEIPDASQASALIFRTCAEDGKQTRARVRQVVLKQ